MVPRRRGNNVRGRHLDEKLIILKATSPEAQWEGKGWTGVLGTRNGWRETTPTRRTLNCLICTRPTRSSLTTARRLRLGTRLPPLIMVNTLPYHTRAMQAASLQAQSEPTSY